MSITQFFMAIILLPGCITIHMDSPETSLSAREMAEKQATAWALKMRIGESSYAWCKAQVNEPDGKYICKVSSSMTSAVYNLTCPLFKERECELVNVRVVGLPSPN